MRALALAVLAVACIGCRSGRDYLSINRTSLSFLFETASESRKMRRQNLRNTLRVGPRIRENLRQQRKGIAFAAGSVWRGTWQEAGNAWRGFKRELLPTTNFFVSLRFGHLDSGD